LEGGSGREEKVIAVRRRSRECFVSGKSGEKCNYDKIKALIKTRQVLLVKTSTSSQLENLMVEI
jgi:hypothetical protein